MPKNDPETMAENLRNRMNERGIKSVAQLAKAVGKETGQTIARETLRRWVRSGVAHVHGGHKKSTRVQLAAVAQYLGFESIESLWQTPAVPKVYRVLGEVVVSDELYQFAKRLRGSEFASFLLSRANRELDICDAFVRDFRRVMDDRELDDEMVRSIWDLMNENWDRIRTMPEKSGDEVIAEIFGNAPQPIKPKPTRSKRAEQKRLKTKTGDDAGMRARPSHTPKFGSSFEMEEG
jgi:hypothetical protein